MKNLFFIALLLLLSSVSLQAQFALGISAGLNNSKTRITGYEFKNSISNRASWHVGVSPAFVFEKLILLSDIQYSVKGARSAVGTAFEVSSRLKLVEVLPEIQYKPIPWLGIGAGVNLGFLLEYEQKEKEGGWKSLIDDEAVNKNCVGIFGTISGHYKNFFLKIRYNPDLKEIVRMEFIDEVEGVEYDIKQFNVNWQFSAGYYFLF